jgi:hypothetical protein
VFTKNESSGVGGRPKCSEAIVTAAFVDNPGISELRLSSSATEIQNPGLGGVRIKPVKTGSPVYRA